MTEEQKAAIQTALRALQWANEYISSRMLPVGITKSDLIDATTKAISALEGLKHS